MKDPTSGPPGSSSAPPYGPDVRHRTTPYTGNVVSGATRSARPGGAVVVVDRSGGAHDPDGGGRRAPDGEKADSRWTAQSGRPCGAVVVHDCRSGSPADGPHVRCGSPPDVVKRLCCATRDDRPGRPVVVQCPPGSR